VVPGERRGYPLAVIRRAAAAPAGHHSPSRPPCPNLRLRR